MERIEYFLAPHSPWSYLGHRALAGVAAQHGAEIEIKPCDFGLIFSKTGGLPLAKRAPARQMYRLEELARWREFRELPLNIHPAFFPVDSTMASLAIISAARSAGQQAAFSLCEQIMRGVWADEQDIAQDAVLRAACAAVGLSPDSVLPGCEAARADYERNTSQALDYGAFGAPWYRWNGQNFWGQDRLESLARALNRG